MTFLQTPADEETLAHFGNLFVLKCYHLCIMPDYVNNLL
jgi:hypothetical protein